ncbi:MAG: hypothetical protein WA704_15890, partial [Pseudolabrys sp.]
VCRIRSLVSGRENFVPGAVMATEGTRARAWRIAGTIRPAHLAESRCRFHGAGVTIVYNGGMNMKAKTNAERQRRYMEKLRSRTGEDQGIGCRSS